MSEPKDEQSKSESITWASLVLIRKKEEKMSESKDKQSQSEPITWASLVPEVFYDLIGRVIPGIAFVIGFVYVSGSQTIRNTFLNFNSTISFILLLGAGYASGLILTVLGDSIGDIPKIGWKEKQYKDYFDELMEKEKDNFLSRYNKKKSNEKDSHQASDNKGDDVYKYLRKKKTREALFQYHYDYVTRLKPGFSRQLAKSLAEVQLCVNTCAAFIVLIVCELVSYLNKIDFVKKMKFIPWESKIVFILFLLLVITLLLFWAANYRNRRFLLRLFSKTEEIVKE